MYRFLKVWVWLFCLALPLIVVAHDNHKKIEVDVLLKSTKSWDGTTLPAYEQGQPEITILKVVVPPKAEVTLHKHPMINAGVMLKGELTVFKKGKENEPMILKAGDAVVETVNTWHYGRNDGNESVEVIVFYAGVVDMPLSIKEEKKEK